MGRILITAGNVPNLRRGAGDARRRSASGTWRGARGQHRGPYEEREAGPVEGYVHLVLVGIGTTAQVMSAIAAWRRRGKAPPRKLVRVVVQEEDEEGHRHTVWVESEK
jgi:hypothetical protein